MKRLIAYSSIGHMGFVAIGIAAWQPVALSGSIIQMANHGVTTGALFCLVGMLDERAHTREIASLRRPVGQDPALVIFLPVLFAGLGGSAGIEQFCG